MAKNTPVTVTLSQLDAATAEQYLRVAQFRAPLGHAERIERVADELKKAWNEAQAHVNEYWMPRTPGAGTYHAVRGTGRVALCGLALSVYGRAELHLPKGHRACQRCIAMGATR